MMMHYIMQNDANDASYYDASYIIMMHNIIMMHKPKIVVHIIH